VVTDLPFKLSETTIVIVKALPAFQCEGCSEYALDDRVMERVDAILEWAYPSAERGLSSARRGPRRLKRQRRLRFPLGRQVMVTSGDAELGFTLGSGE
jgi:YgiT-type zinc finger domain-containing protein